MAQTKAELKAAEVLKNQRAAFEKKVRALLGHVGGRVKRAELDKVFDALPYKGEYGPAAEKLAAEIASREPVGAAIHALKEEAVRYAEQASRKVVARVEKELAEAGWDRHAYAPYPRHGHRGNPEYDIAKAKYSLVHSLTSADRYVGRSNEPEPCHMDAEMVERFVENAMRDAAIQYDMFICKMVAKVGPAKSAELEGSHVWAHSILNVELADGSRERWKTQQIVNYSKYGRPYLQWPSRKVK